ncbi:MAG: hypothetical protein J5517_08425 [Eubacterium sp.]|nr:hypothetical protein [Eubacterium sp.]
MKRFITLTIILALGVSMLAGCGKKVTETEIPTGEYSETGDETVEESEAEDTTEEAEITEAVDENEAEDKTESAEATEEDTAETTEAAEAIDVAETSSSDHEILVTDQSVTTLSDDYDEYNMVIPRLVVDGVDAEAINSALEEHVKTNHPLTEDEYGVSGETTSYAWGTKGNIVSIIIIAGEIGTDGVGYEVFNYNVDTLQAAGNDEVLSTFGLSEADFNGKVEEVYRAWWETETWLQEDMSYLDKSIAAISSTNVTPFALPNGDLGAAGLTYTPSQFMEMVRCFDLDTLSVAHFN